MKIRNGFVSNSSSSSYIIGIALINDENKFKNYIKEKNITNLNIVSINDINYPLDINISNNTVKLDSFMTDVRLIYNNDNDKIVFLYSCGDDNGDQDFWVDEGDYGYMDYDINIDFFDQSIIDAYMVFNSDLDIGLVSQDSIFGAGRNG